MIAKIKLISIIKMKSKRCKRIFINVSGEIYETFDKTLNRFPETLLGMLERRHQYYSSVRDEYYFDRNRQCFDAILFFYQSWGILRCPLDVSPEVFEEECIFYQMPTEKINDMKICAGIIPELHEIKITHDQSGTTRARVWNFLEHPETSRAATVMTIVSLLAILASLIVVILETVGALKIISNEFDENHWALTELVLNSWFLLELTLRFISSPSKKKFIRNWFNWLDAFAVIPYFIMLIFIPDKLNSLGFLRLLRLVRVFRLFKLSKHSIRLQIVGHILSTSFSDLQSFLVCLFILVILSGSSMYYIERSALSPAQRARYPDPQTEFSSIPNSLWWSVITLTTVGYGDIFPATIGGKVFSSLFMVFGALTMTLPVLAIVTKFELFYEKNVGGVGGEIEEEKKKADERERELSNKKDSEHREDSHSMACRLDIRLPVLNLVSSSSEQLEVEERQKLRNEQTLERLWEEDGDEAAAAAEGDEEEKQKDDEGDNEEYKEEKDEENMRGKGRSVIRI